MLPQQLEVPHRLFPQAVVGDHHGSFLGGAEADNRQRWDLGPTQPSGGLPASMAGEDGTGLIDQDWVCPNLLDAPHQARNLRLRMLPRVSREGFQITDR